MLSPSLPLGSISRLWGNRLLQVLQIRHTPKPMPLSHSPSAAAVGLMEPAPAPITAAMQNGKSCLNGGGRGGRWEQQKHIGEYKRLYRDGNVNQHEQQ